LLDGDIEYPAKLSLRLGQSLNGDETSLAIAQQIQPLAAPDLAPEVITQQARVVALESEMNKHPVAKMPDRGAIFKKVNRLEQLQRQIEFQQEMVNERRQRHWQEFMSLVNILQDYGCLEGTQPTETGQVVAALRGENELWLAIALLSGEMDRLSSHHLATVCAAIVSENSRPDNWIKFGLSPTVEDALDGLGDRRRELFRVQRDRKVDIPAWLDYELTGLVEQWALGMEWTELCQNTNLDEGDIVRLMRRTIDLLYQIPHVPHLPPQLYQAAKQAAQMIDRFPVNEVI
jgi:superfamily II RNA helicase